MRAKQHRVWRGGTTLNNRKRPWKVWNICSSFFPFPKILQKKKKKKKIYKTIPYGELRPWKCFWVLLLKLLKFPWARIQCAKIAAFIAVSCFIFGIIFHSFVLMACYKLFYYSMHQELTQKTRTREWNLPLCGVYGPFCTGSNEEQCWSWGMDALQCPAEGMDFQELSS